MSDQDITQSEAAQAEAQSLLDMQENELEYLLTMRLNAIQEDPSLSLQPTFEVEASTLESFTMPPWIKSTVDSMIDSALRQGHRVLCSTDEEFSSLRAQLVAALGLGGTAAVLAFTSFLITTLGFAAALASIVATIVIKKIGEPTIQAGHKTMCAELTKMLND